MTEEILERPVRLLSHALPRRVATVRHYLMCRPSHFDVCYSINPWMDPGAPTSANRACQQWQALHDVLTGLGHRVEVLEPSPGLPDMVFAANGATVVDGKALVARFRHPERDGESAAYLDWFRARGYPVVRQAEAFNEGEGDCLFTGRVMLAGSGFRSDVASHAEIADLFGVPVVALRLVDPQYYHLDTALAVLSEDEIMYNPGAFAPDSRRKLEEMFPGAILAGPGDAAVFGLNAVCDGLNVVLPAGADGVAGQLRQRGFQPIPVDLSELLKAGGAAKCCTLELRARRR